MTEYLNVVKHIADRYEQQEKKQYKYLVFFIMLCMTVIITKGILSYRLIQIHGYIAQAGQLISPFWFLICDIITEIYGYRIAKQTVIAGFVCQTIFTVICAELINLPYPSFWNNNDAYQIVLGDMWRVNIAVLIASIFAGFVNVKLISWWKFLTQGKHFWIRSIGASGLSELLFSLIATFVIQVGKQDVHIILYIVLTSFTLKIIYSLILSIPANIIVFFVKKSEGVN